MQGFSAMVFALQLYCNTGREECNLAIFLYYYPYRGVELVKGKTNAAASACNDNWLWNYSTNAFSRYYIFFFPSQVLVQPCFLYNIEMRLMSFRRDGRASYENLGRCI